MIIILTLTLTITTTLHISLLLVGYDKIVAARDQLLTALVKNDPSGSGVEYELGDKSSPEDIWGKLPGLSKGQFKAAVGALLREGAITIGSRSMVLIEENERIPIPPTAYDGKSPKGFRVSPDGATLFIGNLDFNVDDMLLARSIESLIGLGHIAKIKIATNAGGLRYVVLVLLLLLLLVVVYFYYY